jgi:glycosyltransferase involved in cell wall biosynthesis
METTLLKVTAAEGSAPEEALRERVGAGAPTPLRVAHLMPWPGLGGVATAQLRLALALEETVEVKSIAFCHGGRTRVAEMFADAGLETIGYEAGEFSYFHPKAFLRGSRAFLKLLREQKIDIVHTADLLGVYHAGLACKLARVPLVCHIRSNFEQMLWQYKPPLRAASHFVFVSNAVWRNFDAIYRVPERLGSVIYDWGPEPLDEASAEDARRRVRAEFRIESDAHVIGMIARVQPPKDFATLIRAVSEVVKSHTQARLLCVGEYDHPHCLEHYRELCSLAEELGVSERIIWAGLRNDVADLIRAMDVCVLSTHVEGMPLVLLEAMALRRPVIATRVGGIPELVTHEETGLLFEKNDWQELAREISMLIGDEDRAAQLARGGREHVRANFNKEKTVNKTRSVYARLMKGEQAKLAATARGL